MDTAVLRTDLWARVFQRRFILKSGPLKGVWGLGPGPRDDKQDIGFQIDTKNPYTLNPKSYMTLRTQTLASLLVCSIRVEGLAFQSLQEDPG